MQTALREDHIELSGTEGGEATVASFEDFLAAATLGTTKTTPEAVPTPAPTSRVDAPVSLDTASVADRLFHSVREIHELGERALIDRDVVQRCLDLISAAVMELAPHSDRSEDARPTLVAAPPVVETPASTSQPASVPTDGSRFSRILAEITRRANEGLLADDQAMQGAIAQLLVAALENATDHDSFRAQLARMPQSFRMGAAQVFQVLSRAVASWDLPNENRAESSDSIVAIWKLLSFTIDPMDHAKELRELVTAAVDRLNKGAFSAAVALLELSQTIIDRGSVHRTVIDRIRNDAARSLVDGELRSFLDDKERHALLRRALRFFPALSFDTLLRNLPDERDEQHRQSLLRYLEVWGAEARQAILLRIDEQSARGQHANRTYVDELFLVLSWMSNEGIDEPYTLDVLGRASAVGQLTEVITQTFSAIASLKNETAARLLKLRLAQFVALPFRNESSMYSPAELDAIYDAGVAALAVVGTRSAVRAIVQHCLRNDPALGDTRFRMRHLAEMDLSTDPETLDLLVNAIRADLPAKVFGRIVKSRAQNPIQLIQALGATKGEQCTTLLKEIATEYALYDFGQAAAAVLRQRSQRPSPALAIEKSVGTLHEFGVPRLVKSLADSRVTGILSLANEHQEIRARLTFASGELVAVEMSNLSGLPALYELIERPFAGSYAFVHRQMSRVNVPHRIDLPAAIEEGLRRYDELQRMLAVCAEDAFYKPGRVHPSRPKGEDDPLVLRETWLRASSRESLATSENIGSADTWRIRRIVNHWVGEGSLVPLGHAN